MPQTGKYKLHLNGTFTGPRPGIDGIEWQHSVGSMFTSSSFGVIGTPLKGPKTKLID